MNREFVEKMAQAKKMEAEAFLCLLDESGQEHMQNIAREVREMFMESLQKSFFQTEGKTDEKQSSSKEAKKKVQSVEIG